MSKNILVSVNGELLMSNEYTLYGIIYIRIVFKIPLNSQAQTTSTNVIIVKNGIKIYEEKITQQNISTLNLYSGEISE